MKKWKFLFFLIAFIACERFCHKKTHGFRLHKIFSHLTYNPSWEIFSPSQEQIKEIKAALDQEFYFLGSGGQCYAFVSKDDAYVLKVFKQHHMEQNFWKNEKFIPKVLKPLHKNFVVHNHKPMDKILHSCKLAYEFLKKETALVYIHLNKTDFFHQNITLIDPINIKHTVNLDRVEFVLQYKGSMAYPTLLSLIENKQMDDAKKHLEALLDTILARCRAGILDKDPIIKRNFAFIGEKAIIIDFGCFSYDENLKMPRFQNRLLFLETMKCK